MQKASSKKLEPPPKYERYFSLYCDCGRGKSLTGCPHTDCRIKSESAVVPLLFFLLMKPMQNTEKRGFTKRTIKKCRDFRSRNLDGLGRFHVKIGINANIITFFSLISGVAAAYFLFDNYWLFLLLAVLHLFFDSMDGVVARLSKTTKFGKYFDLCSDSFVTILVLIKLGWFLNDYYVYYITGLFTIALIVHLGSRLKAPIYFMRTVSLIVLAIFSFPTMPFMNVFLTIGYLVAGVFTVFSLAKQLQWVVNRRN